MMVDWTDKENISSQIGSLFVFGYTNDPFCDNYTHKTLKYALDHIQFVIDNSMYIAPIIEKLRDLELFTQFITSPNVDIISENYYYITGIIIESYNSDQLTTQKIKTMIINNKFVCPKNVADIACLLLFCIQSNKPKTFYTLLDFHKFRNVLTKHRKIFICSFSPNFDDYKWFVYKCPYKILRPIIMEWASRPDGPLYRIAMKRFNTSLAYVQSRVVS